jgi:predicted SAM-dependent methyltransferase
MNRKKKILRHIDKNGFGIEIGPSHNPLASKNDGYKVHIIDHMSREQLIAKYRDHGVNLDKIEEVDYVWQGESYSELTGKTKYYDWIIASHLIEHTPDLIGFLNECDTILKNDGAISLIVPDKRYCFDHYRPITGISKIIDSHFQKSTNHTTGTVAEYFLNVVSKSGGIAWNSCTTGEYNFVHSLENALQGMESVVNENAYLDVHAWCFVPHSFRLIIHDLFCLGLISLKEVDFHPTDGCEFYITLGRSGQGVNKTRMEMLEIIDSEIKDGIDINEQP